MNAYLQDYLSKTDNAAALKKKVFVSSQMQLTYLQQYFCSDAELKHL